MPPIRSSVVAGVLSLALAAAPARAAGAVAPLAAGEVLPRLEGHLLSGRDGALPDAGRGRVTLVLLGFSYASRHPVEAWAGRFRARFASDTGVTLFEVPVIGGLSRLGAPFIESGMRKGTPAALRGNVLVAYGATAAWRGRAGWTPRGRDDAYLVVLDRAGVVRWTGHGGWDAERFAALAAEVARLARPAPAP